MLGALFEFRLKLSFLVDNLSEWGDEYKVVGLFFVIIDNFEVGFVLLIDVPLSGIHAGVNDWPVFVYVVIWLVYYFVVGGGWFLYDKDPAVVVGGAIASDGDNFISNSKSSYFQVSAVVYSFFFLLFGHLFCYPFFLLQLLLHLFVLSISLFLFLEFFGLFVEDASGMVDGVDALGHIFLSRSFLFLGLLFKLVDVLFDVGSHGQHVIDELVGVGPHFVGAAVVLNQTVFLFEGVVEYDPDLFCSQHWRIVEEQAKGTVD